MTYLYRPSYLKNFLMNENFNTFIKCIDWFNQYKNLSLMKIIFIEAIIKEKSNNMIVKYIQKMNELLFDKNSVQKKQFVEDVFLHCGDSLKDHFIKFENFFEHTDENLEFLARMIINFETKVKGSALNDIPSIIEEYRLSPDMKKYILRLCKHKKPPRTKVFLAHSNSKKDKHLIKIASKLAKRYNIDLFIAEETLYLQGTITDKIKINIESSQYLITLLTKSASKSKIVGDEIAWANAKGIPYIILKEKEVKLEGLNYGKDFIPLNRKKPTISIEKAFKFLQQNQHLKSGAKR